MMKLLKCVTTVSFSPAGSTKKVTDYIGEQIANKLQIPCKIIDFTLPDSREKVLTFEEDELVIVGSPTYAGKIPNKILPDFKTKLKGKNTLAVPVVTFGNRSFDNALAELNSVLGQQGFVPVAGAALVCRHVFLESVATNRPDESDLKEIQNFISRIVSEIDLWKEIMNQPEGEKRSLVVEGDADAPYYVPLGLDHKPVNFLKVKPVTNKELCDNCGICATVCPMGSIDANNVATVTRICIKCNACIMKCPKHAKYFDDPALLSHIAMIETICKEAKENRFFYLT